MNDPEEPTVLLVEDEPAVLDAFAMMLEDGYAIRTAADGPEALERLDGVDVVLLDRMLPGMDGDEVLAEIRERGADCRIVMVSAVDPDFDIIEMGFDDYVTKPPTEEDLRGTVEEVLERNEFSDRLGEYRSLLAKRSVLMEQKNPTELKDNEAYATLEARIEELRTELDAENDRLLKDTEFVGALRDLGDADGEAER